jgi:hypothetical protein
MIVILRVIRWQTLHGPGYLQQRFAPRPSAGANLFFQQLVQFQIYLGELIPVNFVSSLMISFVLICSLLSKCLQLAARVLRINSLPLALASSPESGRRKTPRSPPPSPLGAFAVGRGRPFRKKCKIKTV